MDKTTRDNLATAMRSEAFTYAKYMLFAERARKTGNPELAQLLEKTAKQELLEHFAEEAALAEIVRSDGDNLEDAIESESYGIESMYRDFAGRPNHIIPEIAKEFGDAAVYARAEDWLVLELARLARNSRHSSTGQEHQISFRRGVGQS